MSHLAESSILSARDLPDAELSALERRHLAECTTCRDLLEEAAARGRRVRSALGALDRDWEFEDARAEVRGRVAALSARAAGAAAVAPRSGRATRTLADFGKAAAAVLVLATGVAALPGSPVRDWLSGDAAPVVDEASSTHVEAAPEAAVTEEAGGASMRVPLTGAPFRVDVGGLSAGDRVEVFWVSAREAAVAAPDGTRFTTGQRRIEVVATRGPIRIELPRGGGATTVAIDGSVYVRSSAAGVVVEGPVVEQDADRVVFTVPDR